MAETVSIHHRMPLSFHRKLKTISLESRLPVTDIMNQALREWIERYDVGATSITAKERIEPSIPARISELRIAKRNGDFHSVLSSMSKSILVDIAGCLAIEADHRMSRDRVVSAIYDAL